VLRRALVLDEFALILHLEDVSWSDEGRISVEMVSLAIACLGLALIGIRPFDLGMFRLARPGSRWARRRYTPEQLARATERARRTDARWGAYTRWMNDFAGMGPASTTD